MKFYKKEIYGVEVYFICLGDRVAWFCWHKGDHAGDFVRVNETDDIIIKEVFEIVEQNAEGVIKNKIINTQKKIESLSLTEFETNGGKTENIEIRRKKTYGFIGNKVYLIKI